MKGELAYLNRLITQAFPEDHRANKAIAMVTQYFKRSECSHSKEPRHYHNDWRTELMLLPDGAFTDFAEIARFVETVFPYCPKLEISKDYRSKATHLRLECKTPFSRPIKVGKEITDISLISEPELIIRGAVKYLLETLEQELISQGLI